MCCRREGLWIQYETEFLVFMSLFLTRKTVFNMTLLVIIESPIISCYEKRGPGTKRNVRTVLKKRWTIGTRDTETYDRPTG